MWSFCKICEITNICLGLCNFQKDFIVIISSYTRDNTTSSLWRCRNWDLEFTAFPELLWTVNGRAGAGTDTFRLQGLHSSDHPALAQGVFTPAGNRYQFWCSLHCVLFPPHFLALEVPFLHLKSLQKQRFQLTDRELSLFFGLWYLSWTFTSYLTGSVANTNDHKDRPLQIFDWTGFPLERRGPYIPEVF